MSQKKEPQLSPEETLRQEIERVVKSSEEYGREHSGDSGRAAAILIAADFENVLQAKIEDEFVKLNREDRDTLFDGHGALSTFSAKIEIGYALGLYGRKTRNRLRVAKNIRDDFAHAAEPLDFDASSISNHCKKLEPNSANNSDDPRERYSCYLGEVKYHLEHASAANAIPDRHNLPPLP